MGHKKKDQRSSVPLRQQAYLRLKEMQKAGEGQSRHKDKKEGTDRERIYSFKSFQTHMQTMKQFCRWLEINHPECRTLKKARKYVREWLESLEGRYSAYTIQTRAKGVGKYYGIEPTDSDYYTPPVRHREDISRSRARTKTDAHFSKEKNRALIHFCKHTGLRRAGIESIKKESLCKADFLLSEAQRIERVQSADRSEKEAVLLDCVHRAESFFDRFEYYVLVCEKGGKWRLAPVIGSADDVQRVVDRFETTAPGHRVWGKVNKNADIHSYRAEYASALYRQFARPLNKIPYDKINAGSGRSYQSEVYVCRGNEAGKRFDKQAMLKVEKALGHESLHTFASHYSYKL